MQQESAGKILASSFTTPDGGSRGAGALGGAMRDKIGNTAVLFVRPDGKAKFVELKDWGAGRGARQRPSPREAVFGAAIHDRALSCDAM